MAAGAKQDKGGKAKGDKRLFAEVMRGLVIGLLVAAFVILVTRTQTFSKFKLLFLDANYVYRNPVHFRFDLGYIDFDDTSISQFGKWPWSRNRQVALIETLDLYDAKVLGYDVFFTEPNDIVFNPGMLEKAIAESGAMREASGRVSESFRDYDAEMVNAIKNAENVYLSEFMILPEAEHRADGAWIASEVERIRAQYTDERREALEIASRYAIEANPGTSEMLFRAIDAVVPLASFGDAAAGIGFAQITEDLDKTVRLYPLFIGYDNKIFPSIVVVILSKTLGVPLDSIVIKPGDYVEFPNAVIPPEHGRQAQSESTIVRTIRIPVDRNCQMLVNWAGGFYDNGYHVSFSDISYFFAFNKAKSIARQYPADPSRFAGIASEIRLRLLEEGLVSDADADSIAEEISLAWIAEGMLHAREDSSLIAVELAAACPDVPSEKVGLVVAIVAASKAYCESSFEYAGAPNPEWSAEIKRNLDFFMRTGKLELARPLYFAPVRRAVSNGYSMPLSPTYLEKRIFMAGLTGEGTIDLNPTPFQRSCPMVALHINTLNTILTEQYLKFPINYMEFAAVLAFSLIIGGLVISPARLLIVGAVLAAGYTGFVYWAWNADGQWVENPAPLLAIALTWSVKVVLAFIVATVEKQKVRGIFSTMVSPKVLKLMEENPDRFSLSGERKEATIFFSSIEGFGEVMRREAPEELTHILGSYLTPTSDIIMDYDGYIDKYEGHVIMADFGVPLDDPDHPWKCCFAAIEQQMDIEAFRLFVLARYGVEVKVSMGINSGFISAGNMGSEKKMQYTVMGDAVNVSARFRPANGIYGTGIITGEATEALVRDAIELRLLDRLLLKGKTVPTTIYEIMGWKPEAYLAVKKERPLPDSLLRRWLNCPPQKVFGFIRYWRRIHEESGSAIAGDIAAFFESQVENAEGVIVNAAVFSVDKNYADVAELAETMKRIDGRDEDPEAERAGDEPLWERKLLALIARLERIEARIKEVETDHAKIVDASISVSDLALTVDTMRGKILLLIENLPKRPKSGLETVARALAAMREKLEGKEFPGAVEKLQECQANFKTSVAAFFSGLIARSAEYHEAMAYAGSLTEKRRRVKENFERALAHYFERRWDESESFLRKALDDDPNDGPTLEFLSRIASYRVEPPPASWQGEYVQRKK